MKRIAPASATLIALSLALLLPAAIARQPSVEEGELQFRLPDLDGNVVSSSDPRFAGKVVLVNLWGTWCPPCLTEIPTLIELQEQFGGRGLVIVAIAFEDDETEARRQRLREFSREHDINYLVLDGGLPEDFESTLPGVIDIKGLPVEVLIDRTGRVVKARNSYGYRKSWAKKLRREIDSLLELPAAP